MKRSLNVRNLDLAYGKRTVLQGVSFSVREREFFIIIGPNGSGKSSLVKAISGTVRPDKGDVEILGRPLRSCSRKWLARSVALVPQNQPMDVPFSVAEIVLMGRSPYMGLLGMESVEDLRIAEHAMSFTGVSELAGRKFDRLSTGERQRVLIARAVCQQPRIMVLDEPTASLDLAHQIHIMELMEKLRSLDGTTIVMVSHDLNLAAMYADRLLLLKEGKIMSLGAPGEVLNYETLERTYGCVLLVDDNPVKNVPRITLVPAHTLTRKNFM
jgi:iron complex transport system ATP-binding protein